MRVLFAFDKFKGSLTASRACALAARALRACRPDWQVDQCPLTDGGDGFASLLTKAAGGDLIPCKVAGPRGGLVDASIGLVSRERIPAAAAPWLDLPGVQARPGSRVAVVEMASASGLGLLRPEQRDPWRATTYGTGQLLRAAAELGASVIVLGVGGSATNDLGLGALAAVGVEFRGSDGAMLRSPEPHLWDEIATIEGSVFPSIPPICIACDVTSPLLGPRGAAAVYGLQKGLLPGDLARMEAAVARMADLLCASCGKPPGIVEAAGTGAAGGLPFGLLAAARCRIVPGFSLTASWLRLPERIAAADIVVTGEGCFDASSLVGKGPGSLAALARGAGKQVHVFAGRIGGDLPSGEWQLHAIAPAGQPLDESLRLAGEQLARSVQSAFQGGELQGSGSTPRSLAPQ